jgi:hypothetical protein
MDPTVRSAFTQISATLFRSVIMTMAVVILLLPASGCVDLTAVSKFTSQSSEALTQGKAVLEDIEASCVRSHIAEEPIPADKNQLFDPNLVSRAAADPACMDYAKVQTGELSVLQILTDYFTALSQLASTGTASTGKNASSSAQTAKQTSSQPENVLGAVSGLADFLGQVVANGYHERKLDQGITDRNDDVAAVISGLKDIVQNRYENDVLVKEQQIITVAASDRVDGTTEKSIKALYRIQWQGAMDLITQKKVAADAFLKALDTIQQGHNALTKTTSPKAKSVSSIIQPYTDSISSLIPSIQKAL